MRKKKIMIAVCAAVLLAAVCAGVIRGKSMFTKKKVDSFDSVRLTLSGMRGTSEYELLAKGEQTEISFYSLRSADGEEERLLEQRAVCDTGTVLTLLNDCRLANWDGFHGKHPRGVLDGTIFVLEATVNGGEILRAEGSQNFPKGYRELLDGLYGLLNAQERSE